jgi:hypothetical protein
MIKTIQLLAEKNNFLEKFVNLNTNQIDRIKVKDFTDLEEFREAREGILKILIHIDTLVEQRTSDINPDQVPEEVKKRLSEILEKKDEYLSIILNQDLLIMQIIDEAKSELILDLQSVRKSKKTISSYKGNERQDILDEDV